MKSRITSDRLRDLQSITDAALAYLPLEGLLDELLTRVVGILGVDTAAILLLEDDDSTLIPRAAKGLEEEVERGIRIPIGRGFAGRIAATRSPVRILNLAEADIYNPILREKGLQSLLGVPLLVEGEVMGVLHVGTLTPRAFDDEDVELLQRAGDRAALAIASRLTERERGLTDALQRSLMPRLPELPAVALAGRYLPAASERLGGDWYDAFVLPDGRLGMAIGDVVGRGFQQPRSWASSAAACARTRWTGWRLAGCSSASAGFCARSSRAEPRPSCTSSWTRTAAPSRSPPRATRRRSSRLQARSRASSSCPARCRSAPRATFAMRTICWSSTPARRWSSTRMVWSSAPASRSTTAWTADRHGAGRRGGPGAPGRQLVDVLLPEGPGTDDAALLMARAMPLGKKIVARFPAEVESIPGMRRLLGRWLDEAGATQRDVDDLTLAAAEAAANAIEHAYGLAPGVVELHASTDGEDTVTVEICDFGSWRAPRGTHRGRGLLLMEGLTDDVEVVRTGDGTTVELTRRIGVAVA